MKKLIKMRLSLTLLFAGTLLGIGFNNCSQGFDSALVAHTSSQIPAGDGTPQPQPEPEQPLPSELPTIPPGDLIPYVNLISLRDQTQAPFAFGQMFRPGEFPPNSQIKTNLANTQVTIKNRWPDGSPKFAIVAGRTNLTGNSPLKVSFASSDGAAVGALLTEADLKSLNINAAIEFSPFGSVDLGSLIGVTSSRALEFIRGPEMSSWIYYSPIGSDPHLTAWFEVRLYRGGSVEILPWIENGFLNVAGPTNKIGTATFRLGGSTRFTSNLELKNHTRTYLGSGTTFSHFLGADPQVTVIHNVIHLQSTRATPSYFAKTSADSSLWSSLAKTFTPFSQSNFPNGMGSAGYHPSIGVLPQWDAAYLTSQGDPRAFRAVVINAYSAGRYSIHFRDESTNRPLKFSSYPNLCLGEGSGVTSNGSSSKNTYTPESSGGTNGAWASSHHPSVGYMAYLLTGRYYFLEQIQFAATIHFLKQTDTIRGYTKGLLLTNVGANTTRGAGWALRTLAQAAFITPDEDVSLKTEFENSLGENILYYHNQYIAKPSNPLGVMIPYSDYTKGDNKYFHSIWMEDFMTAAVGMVMDMNFGFPSTTQVKLREFFDWKSSSVIGRLGAQGDPTQYNFRDAAQYTLAVAPSDSPDWSGGTGPWYKNWGEVYTATLGQANSPSSDTSLRGAYFPESVSYWGNMMPALAYAVTNKAPGALTAYQRVVNSSNWNAFVEDSANTVVWAVAPRNDGN
jgi:hypothetical protein